MTSFWCRHQITSPKIRHQNDVTKIFRFQAFLLSKILVASLLAARVRVLLFSETA